MLSLFSEEIHSTGFVWKFRRKPQQKWWFIIILRIQTAILGNAQPSDTATWQYQANNDINVLPVNERLLNLCYYVYNTVEEFLHQLINGRNSMMFFGFQPSRSVRKIGFRWPIQRHYSPILSIQRIRQNPDLVIHLTGSQPWELIMGRNHLLMGDFWDSLWSSSGHVETLGETHGFFSMKDEEKKVKQKLINDDIPLGIWVT